MEEDEKMCRFALVLMMLYKGVHEERIPEAAEPLVKYILEGKEDAQGNG